jgi:beta-lactamase regulating signal transducer with metallopeptidase domain/Tol biopolymer transport system component
MRTLFDLSTLDAVSRAGLAVLLDATLKATLVLAAASLLCLLLRRASAATRHLLLCVALGQVALMPLLSLALPGWQLPILLPPELALIQTAPWLLSPPTEAAAPISPPAARSQPGTLAPAPVPSPARVMGPPKLSGVGPQAGRSVLPAQEPLADPPPLPRGLMGLLLVWAAGVLLVTAPLLAGALSLRRIARGSPPPAEASWTTLLHRLAAELGLRRPVTLRESSQVSVPMTWGVLRPLVLLPTHAHDWSPERRRLVLLHELAHVQRADYLTQLLAQFVCALYWFNPLTWLAARQLRVERERACDDQVLHAGTKASAYAEHLLEIARLARRASCASLAAVAMARPSQLEGRLLAVLDVGRSRRAVSRLAALAAVVAGSAAVLPLAGMEAAARGGQSAAMVTQLGARSRAPRDLGARRVWADPNVDLDLSPSPDGRYLPYVDWAGNGDLVLRDLATGRNRRLAKGSWIPPRGYADTPVMSRDSKQVAYTWWHRGAVDPPPVGAEDACDLRIIERDGSRLRVIYRNEKTKWMSPIDWSPDGKQILALMDRKQVVWLSAADGSLRVIKTFERDVPARIRLSPDGRTLAYDYPPQADAPERDIFLLASDGSRETRLVQHPADDLVAGWAPDGQQLLFASDRGGALGVWRVRIAEGRSQGAPELAMREMGDWSPLRLTRDGSLYYGLRAGIADVYTTTLDPATGRLLAPPQPVNPRRVGFNSSPAWSPDGRSLAYQTKERDELRTQGDSRWASHITIRSVESGETRELSLKHPLRVGQPSWSPDGGSLLAFGANPGSAGDHVGVLVYRINAQTGALTAIPESVGLFNYLRNALVVAPDGKTLFYALRVNDGKTRPGHALKVRDLETGQDKELYRTPGRGIRGPALSLDGRQLAFATRDALMVISTAGGEPRELLRARGENTPLDISSLVWMPDGRHLLYNRGDEVWRISVAGGEPQRAGLAMPELRGLCVHPDGRQIAFTAGMHETELWVLEGLFPAARTARAPAPQR